MVDYKNSLCGFIACIGGQYFTFCIISQKTIEICKMQFQRRQSEFVYQYLWILS